MKSGAVATMGWACAAWVLVAASGATASAQRPGEPGSGVAREDPEEATPDMERLRAPLPVRPRDESEVAGLEQLEQLVGRYRAAYESMAHTLSQQLLIEATEKRHAAEEIYRREIRTHAAKARLMRAQAMRRYEDFLALHPKDPTWTPEIMFRLAELHFEASSDRVQRQEEAFERELVAYRERLEKDPDAEPPASPTADYRTSIDLFGGIVAQFPHYAHNDAALYMMGTLLFEQEQFDDSRRAYLALACADRHPLATVGTPGENQPFAAGDYADCEPLRGESRFVDEAWLRVGEVHYDFDELAAAQEAYEQITDDPKSDLYDEALIRLAWTQYLRRSFADAALSFDRFVQYADVQRVEGVVEGAIQLRDEAIKYLATTYLEEDWDGDGQADARVGFERLDADYRDRENEPHVPEVFAALGDLYAVQTEYARAIEIWRDALRRWPLAPKAPAIQLRILQAYNMLQDKENATSTRDALATGYLRGTPWYEANRDDPEALEAGQKLAEEALVATAVDHHQRAQTLRAAGDPAALREYAIAARAYAAYLERFPGSETSYEYRYHYAEALFYSDQWLEAAKAYGEVRDSNLDNRLQRDAAAGAVAAWEKFVEHEQQAGRLALAEMPKKDAKGPFDQPKTIAPAYLQLRAAYLRAADVVPDPGEAATQRYLAAEILQRHHHFDQAEQEFAQIITGNCEHNVAINAGKAIIDGYVARGNLEGTERWTERMMDLGCGEGDAGSQFAGELKSLKNAVRFQEATLLYEAGEYEAAADRYVALVDQAPNDPNADRALNNAAVAYEKVGRYASAGQTYQRIYTNHPDSEFADDALLRSGFNHIRFFEFDRAISSYLVLAQDGRYKDSEHREVALWNAADLADNLQDYRKSAALYQQFSEGTEDEGKAAEAAFRAAEVTAKTGDERATVRAFADYVRRYGERPQEAARALQAHVRMGQAHAALGNRSKAESLYRDTVALFEARGLGPGSEPADFAAEAQFQLAEYAMGDYLSVRLTSTGKRLERETKDLLEKMQAAAKAYEKVATYRRADWALAAVYRIGYAFEQTAIKLREAPVPRQLPEYSESWFAYKDIVGNAAQQFEQSAIRFYRQTLAQAKSYNLANEWTRAATERLNIYLPEEFPLLREPALDLEVEDRR